MLGAAGTIGVALLGSEMRVSETPRPRVFWSGGAATREAAERFAKANGGVTLEMTFPGKVLDTISLSINLELQTTQNSVHFSTKKMKSHN